MKKICRPELDFLEPYKPGKPISEVKRQLKLENVIKLASNECPYPPFPQALEAISAFAPELNRYPDGSCILLKERLADYLGIPVGRLMVGNGSNELIRLIAQAVLYPGEEAVMGIPSFIVYAPVTYLMGAKPVQIPLIDYRLDLNTMKDAITEKTKLVFLCSPNNPTGTISYRDEVIDFVAGLREDLVIVFDEAYFEYVDDERYISGIELLDSGPQVVVLRTFSKIYGLAGLRVGYGVAPEFLVEAVNKVREPFSVNAMAQVAATCSLDNPEELARRRELNGQGKAYIYEEITKLGLRYVPTQANFILVQVGREARQVSDQLMRRGVIVRSGEIFGYPEAIRVTIGTPEENELFIRELTAVLRNSGDA